MGGGGSGGAGIARIDGNGRVTSILITDSGAGYVDAPSVLIHSGGWREWELGSRPLTTFLFQRVQAFSWLEIVPLAFSRGYLCLIRCSSELHWITVITKVNRIHIKNVQDILIKYKLISFSLRNLTALVVFEVK